MLFLSGRLRVVVVVVNVVVVVVDVVVVVVVVDVVVVVNVVVVVVDADEAGLRMDNRKVTKNLHSNFAKMLPLLSLTDNRMARFMAWL